MTQLNRKLNKSVTMDDVALRAGVSKASASTVLHGSRGNTRVGEGTRQRILAAARDLHYTPNGLAQALRKQTSNVIGLYLGDWKLNTHDLFLAEIVGGLQTGCHEHRKDLLLHGTFRGQSVDDIYSEVINGKIDGLVMFVQGNDALVSRLSSAFVPVVAVADAVPNLPSVVVDDRGGARMIVDHLASKGHRKILYCRGVHSMQTSVMERTEGLVSRASELGIAVIDAPSSSWPDVSDVAIACLKQSPPDRPTAIVGNNDMAAYVMLEYCKEIGLRVPQDISIVGFDGIVPPMFKSPHLTTIRAPWLEVARTAVDIVVRGASDFKMPSRTVLPVELIQGETS